MDDAPGVKYSQESIAHYLARQLLLIESMGQPDEAFGTSVRRILQGMRSQLEQELAGGAQREISSDEPLALPADKGGG